MNRGKEHNKLYSDIFIFFISVILFIMLTMPFRIWLSAANLTQMRPSTALTPVIGMIFGIPACAGCAVGYLISDLFSGYELSYSIFGVIGQLLYGLVPYFMWKKLNKEHDGNEFRLDSVSRMLKFLFVMLIDSLLVVICTGVLNHAYSVADFISFDNLYLFLNSFDSGLLFGCPLMVAGHFLQRYLDTTRKYRKEKVFIFSLNERMIINTIIIGVAICILIGAAVYITDKMNINDSPVGLWGRIYLFQTLALNFYFAMSLGFMWFTEKRIANPIQDLAEMVKLNDEEQPDSKKREKMLTTCEKYAGDSTEVGNLSRSYIKMINNLEKYIDNLKNVTAEKERINAELTLASDIQAHMLPCIYPAFPEHDEFDVYAIMTPAKEVGGDFYDFFMIDETHLAVVMADVSGKGVPAALFMVITKTLIKNQAQILMEPDEVFTSVNKLLCDGNDAGLFVTAWIGILDIKTGKLTYANAGHNPPLIKNQNDDFIYLKSAPGFVLAGLDTTKYRKNELYMNKGDRLFLYTDGVTEATNADNMLYGEEKLKQFLDLHKNESATDILHNLKKDIDLFVDRAPQFDDITMLMLDFGEMEG